MCILLGKTEITSASLKKESKVQHYWSFTFLLSAIESTKDCMDVMSMDLRLSFSLSISPGCGRNPLDVIFGGDVGLSSDSSFSRLNERLSDSFGLSGCFGWIVGVGVPCVGEVMDVSALE